MTEAMHFTLDGHDVVVEAPSDAPLLAILREKLDATETKIGCGIGRCGACLVLVDGAPANACLVLAYQLQDKSVTTSAGLEADPVAQIVREALAEASSFQCGYCAPGIAMALTALFSNDASASDAAITAVLEGHLCRCTGYHSILRGARLARARLAEPNVSQRIPKFHLSDPAPSALALSSTVAVQTYPQLKDDDST